MFNNTPFFILIAVTLVNNG